MKKNNGNFKKILTAFILIIILIVLMIMVSTFFNFLKEPTPIFLIKKDTLSEEEIIEALILREEEVITDGSKRLLHQEVFEGEKVSKGMKIFRYYSNEESKQIDRIAKIDKEIQEHLIEQQDNINSPENTIIDSSIEAKLLELNSLNQQSRILSFEKSVNEEILQKAKIAGELSKEGSQIKKLLDEKKSIEERLTGESKIIYSPIAGTVSYRVDGFEENLNKNEFNKINKENLAKYDIKVGSIIPETKDKCKIVNNFENYLVVKSKSKHAMETEVGDKVKIRIANEDEVVAIVEAVNDAGKDGKIIVFKISVNTERLLQYRKIKIEIIWWEDQGLKVNNKAFIKDNDFSYIARKRGTIVEQILVKIIKETDEFSLIRNYTTEELNDMKLDLTKNRVTINENDEILINPQKYIQE